MGERLEEIGTLQQQAQHNRSLSTRPSLTCIEFMTAVVGAMACAKDLAPQIINNAVLSQKLFAEPVPIIYKGMRARA